MPDAFDPPAFPPPGESAAPNAVPPPLTSPTGAPVPPAPTPADGGGRRRVAGLPVTAWIGVGIVAIGALITAVVLTRGDGGPGRLAVDVPPVTVARPPVTATLPVIPGTTEPDPDVTSPQTTAVVDRPVSSTAPASTDPPAATASTPDTAAPGSTPVPIELGDGSTPDRPLPTGTPESVFAFVGWSGEGAGTVIGVYEVPTWDPDDDDEATCYVMLATVRPTAIAGFVSEAADLPEMRLLVGRDAPDIDRAACDTSEVSELGYHSAYETQATVGTDVPFYVEFTVAEGDRPGVIEVSSTGGRNDDAVYFDATPGDTLPPPPVGEVGPLTAELVPVAAGAPGAFTHPSPYFDDVWSGSVVGILEGPVDEYNTVDGRCLTVLLDLVPDQIDAGIVSQGFAAPTVGLIADGRLIDDHYGCDEQAATDAGYLWISSAEVTPGTQVPAFATVFIPAPQAGEVSAIVVGDTWGGTEATLFEPFLLEAAPPVERPAGKPSGLTPEPTGEAVGIDHAFDGSEWEVTVFGLGTTEPAFGDVDGTCLILFAEATKIDGDSGDTTAAPYPYLLVDGYLVTESYGCDTEAAEDAGFDTWFGGSVEVGGTARVFAQFIVPTGFTEPELIIIGDPSSDSAVPFAPTALDTIPPAAG